MCVTSRLSSCSSCIAHRSVVFCVSSFWMSCCVLSSYVLAFLRVFFIVFLSSFICSSSFPSSFYALVLCLLPLIVFLVLLLFLVLDLFLVIMICLEFCIPNCILLRVPCRLLYHTLGVLFLLFVILLLGLYSLCSCSLFFFCLSYFSSSFFSSSWGVSPPSSSVFFFVCFLHVLLLCFFVLLDVWCLSSLLLRRLVIPCLLVCTWVALPSCCSNRASFTFLATYARPI